MIQASSRWLGILRLAAWPSGSAVGDHQAVADDRSDVRLAEDEPGALVGVVGVDRDVGGAGGEDAHDRDVEVRGART